MQTEIEAKFTDIDPDHIRERLKELGAHLEHPQHLMRRVNYDYADGDRGWWVRVRDEGEKVTMTYKRLEDRTLHGTKEVNLIVDSFERAEAFLRALGMKGRALQETKREAWTIDACEIMIDEWPWIPPFIEIEGPTEEAVRVVADKLGVDWSKALHGSVEPVYQQHYDVTEDEINHYPEITFGPVPDWLEAKRKKTPA